jgi:hypothetical protein
VASRTNRQGVKKMNAVVTFSHLLGHEMASIFSGQTAGEILAKIIRVRMKMNSKPKPKARSFKFVSVSQVGAVFRTVH